MRSHSSDEGSELSQEHDSWPADGEIDEGSMDGAESVGDFEGDLQSIEENENRPFAMKFAYMARRNS